MKIAVLSTNDINGGAAMSAYRLHSALRKFGHDSNMFVQSKSSVDFSVKIENKFPYRFINQLRPGFDRLPLFPTRVRESYSTGFFSNRHMVSLIKKSKPDIVHLQWVNGGFLSVSDVLRLNLPTVWRLPDWWLLTAGCHLPYDCKLYQTGCAHCPRLNNSIFFDRSAWLFKSKYLDVKKLKNIKFVAPSRALAADARASKILCDVDIRVIPNGLDLLVHKPVDKLFARQVFNFSPKQKIVLFGAVNGRNDPNKGYLALLQALSILKYRISTPFECVTFGSEAGIEKHEDILVRSVGVLRDQYSLNLLYSAADVLVVPSYQESFGQTAIEAMACGTPVVGFQTTGLLDIVDSGRNGYLANKFDVEDLANGIRMILENSDSNLFSEESRRKVEREFDLNQVVTSYLGLYEEVVSNFLLGDE